MLKKHIYTLLLLLFVNLTAYSQQQTINLNWQQGMRCGKVTEIVQDKKGCIWMATDGGLHCWDGYRFTIYNTENSPISENELNTVLVDDDGVSVWMGTRGEGLCRFNTATGEWTIIKKKDGLLANGVTRLTHASDGGIWVTCYLKGVSHLSPNGIWTHYSSDNVKGLEPPNWTALDDGHGHLYVGHLNTGLSVIDMNTKKLLNYHRQSSEEPRGDGTKVPMDNEIFTLCWDKDSLLWCGTYYSLFAYSPHENLFVKHISTPSQVLAIICKKNGEIIYSGSDEGGFGLFEDRLGNVWKSNNEIGVTVNCHSHLLFASSESNREDVKIAGLSVIYDTIHVGKRTYVGTVSGLWEQEEGESLVERKDINDQLDIKMVYGVAEDRQGKIWVGTFGEGLHIFQQDGKKMATFEDVPSSEIIQLICDSKGRIWMASHNGLSLFTDTKTPKLTRTYSRADGLSDNMIWSICEDRKGRIWMSSNNGISCLYPETGIIKNYTYSEGIPCQKFKHRQAYLMPDGRICFEQEQGSCIFDPDYVEQRRSLTNCFISSFNLICDNSDSKTDSLRIIPLNSTEPEQNFRLRFSHNENNFIVSLGVEDIAQAKSIEFQYKLEGRDDIWYNVGIERNITLHNVHPGNYQLKIRARLENGEWNEKICRPLSFTVAQPWWWTWWMRLLYITLFILFILWQFKQYRQRQLLKRFQTSRLTALYATNNSENARKTDIENSYIDETLATEDVGKNENNEQEEQETSDNLKLDENGNSEHRQLDKEFLNQLDTIIQDSLTDEDLDTQKVTNKMCISYSALYRKLKELTGMNVTEYIRKHRLTKAMQLLGDGYNVNETMMRCGFFSRNYFRKCFKEEFGILPSQV